MGQFVVKGVGIEQSRLGQLGPFPTPMFLVHTLGGSVPHLTAQVFEQFLNPGSCGNEAKVQSLPPIQVSIESTFPFHESVQPSGQSISGFVGLPKCPSFLTVHDPRVPPLGGYNDKFGISIWPRFGRQSLSIEKHLALVSAYKPDYFQILSDSDVSGESSVKRSKKSMSRNLEFLQATIANEVNLLENSKAFATIEMGWFETDPIEGNKTVLNILERIESLQGFYIRKLNSMDPQLLSQLLRSLPDSKPKIVPGPLSPAEIISLVLQGVDGFDSSIVTRLTNEGRALHFSLKDFLPETESQNGEGQPNSVGSNLKPSEDLFILDLNSKEAKEDFSPISEDCRCYTCQRHSRSYLHHLLETSELLGPVLLMSHNLFHFDLFFQAVRACLLDSQKLFSLQDRLKGFDAGLVQREPSSELFEPQQGGQASSKKLKTFPMNSPPS